MKSYRLPLALLGIALLIVVVSESNRPREVDWSPGWGANETKPLGGYILRDQLKHLFPHQEIVDVDETAYEALYDSHRTIEPGSNYIIVTDELSMSELDTRSYLEFIREGGCGFIAASSIEGVLADSLYVELERGADLVTWEDTPAGRVVGRATLRFTSPSVGEDRTYEVRTPAAGFRGAQVITLFDEDVSRIIETTAEEVELPVRMQDPPTDHLITGLRIELDAGEIILTSLPEGLSNVSLLEEEGLERASVLLSYLPTAPIYWDEYYKPSANPTGTGVGSGSPLSYVMSRPPLYTAWLLILGGLLLFIIFAARRRQRVIPVVDPPRNVTLDFVETVGHLYHDQGSYTAIAARRTSSLLEYVREHLALTTVTIDDLFVSRLTERSGVDPERTAALASWIRRVENGEELEAEDLLAYDREIEYFYANTER